MKLIGLYEGNLETPEENRFVLYFSYKTFEYSEFVAKIINYIGKKPEVIIGTEAKFNKTRIKAKASSNGKIAFALHKKVLPRTSFTGSGEFDLTDLNIHKFGFYFSFYAKSF